MAKDPAFLFYSSDFLTGVANLTMEERGQYITLLCLQQQNGHLSEKTIRLSVGSVSVDVLSKFVKDSGGNYFNVRLEKEIQKRSQYIDSRVNNGKLGGRPRNHKDNHKDKDMDNHMRKHSDNVNRNENKDINRDVVKVEIYPSFNDFWGLYDKKTDRASCERKWNKLKQSEKEAIIKHLPAYIESTPDKQFRKNPETYLNQKGWEHEIILPAVFIPQSKIQD